MRKPKLGFWGEKEFDFNIQNKFMNIDLKKTPAQGDAGDGRSTFVPPNPGGGPYPLLTASATASGRVNS